MISASITRVNTYASKSIVVVVAVVDDPSNVVAVVDDANKSLPFATETGGSAAQHKTNEEAKQTNRASLTHRRT